MNLHEYQAKELLAKYGLPVQHKASSPPTVKKLRRRMTKWAANLLSSKPKFMPVAVVRQVA